jgi:nitroreductase
MVNDLYDFVTRLRAIREYADRPLADGDLEAILEAARWTGSAKNRQRWSFVVIREPEQLERLAACGDHTEPVRGSAATIVIVVEQDGYEFDSGRVAQNIMLAASAIGVASCPITLHRQHRAERLLGVGTGRACRYAVALGYPAPGASPSVGGGRKPLEDLVHWERYRTTS